MKNSKIFTKLSYRKKEMLKNAIVIAAAALIIVFIPFLSIWALNTLFPVLAIPYTVQTWAAAIILGGTLTHTKYIKK